ncbi:MAG: AAA family ATPase [Thermodesulfobacteriota bacterium]|nr:AAA family ATPase [Thermodesulfobacteriota bacterium]
MELCGQASRNVIFIILQFLRTWSIKENRKPLILRGARQVGKTTAVQLFALSFDKFLYLNLEKSQDRALFENKYPIKELINAIFFYKNEPKTNGKILLFIDEIQNSPEAVAQLRYFYEDAKDLYVIAAGSLLESLIGKHISFPVGRVEYMVVRPCTFEEFLLATNETQSLDILNSIPLPEFAHDKLLHQFYQYTMIGGMPEVIQHYVDTNDILMLKPVYDSLVTSYMDDVEKYAPNRTLGNVIRHVILTSFYHAGSRIKFQGFGKSNYKSREIAETMRILEKAMLLYLVYPSIDISLPIQPDFKKSPKLQLLDTGLVNYVAGLQKQMFGTQSLTDVYEGKIAEHIVGQELLAQINTMLPGLHFWVREKKQSSAEVDFLYPYKDMVIPVEVKAGAAGRLRSIHQFIDRSLHPYAIRIYSGLLKIDREKTINQTPYLLLNLPFYLVGRINDYVTWFLKVA